jgi:nucleoside-diphosphate-sugar epimerase
MQKVVITGSSGRIGRAIHWRLCRDFKVTGVDLSPASSTAVIADITDYDALLRIFEGCDTIFHTAALHAPHVGLQAEGDFYKINVAVTEKICKAALASGVSCIVFTSTTALYGYANFGQGQAAWINEETQPLPRTIYHQTKLDAENLLKTYADKGLSIRVIRMSRCFPEPVDIQAVYRLHRGVDYRDVAEAHLLAATTPQEKVFDTFVISGNSPFLKSDCTLLWENPEIVIRNRYPELAAVFESRGWSFPIAIDRVYDAAYAKQVLGWQSRHNALEVIRQYDHKDFEVLPPGSKIS